MMPLHLKALLSTALAVLSIGCTKQPAINAKTTPTPFAVIEKDGVRHELYRGLSFEQFTPSIPSGSVDTIHFDMTLQNYSIALVTVPITNGVKTVQFTTTFKSENQTSATMTWTMASGKVRDKACGIFLVPASTVSASTSISEFKRTDETAIPHEASNE